MSNQFASRLHTHLLSVRSPALLKTEFSAAGPMMITEKRPANTVGLSSQRTAIHASCETKAHATCRVRPSSASHYHNGTLCFQLPLMLIRQQAGHTLDELGHGPNVVYFLNRALASRLGVNGHLATAYVEDLAIEPFGTW